jgi:hypothetical protein
MEKVKMILDTGTLIGITIALASSCVVMVISIRSHRDLMRENKALKALLRAERETKRGGNN